MVVKRFCFWAMFLTALSFGLPLVAASGKTPLVWHVSHFPPANITDGQYKNEGFADKTRAFFQSRMPEFSHEEEIIGFKESFDVAKSKTSICRADLLKTPQREQFLIYSEPIYFLSGRRLVTKRKTIKMLQPFRNKKGEIEFERLISSNGIRLSFVPSRAYFKNEPVKFSAYKEKHPQFAYDTSLGSFDAFMDDKVDFVIAYAFEFGYYARIEAREKPFRSFRIAGVQPFAVGYIACTKNDKGRQIIAKINQIVEEQNGAYPWLDYYKDWVSEDEINRVEKYILRQGALKS